MKCRQNIERIDAICRELMAVIDESRAHCDDDECELIHCVVQDCVEKMRRATTRWRPEHPIDTNPAILDLRKRTDRAVN